MMRLDAVIALFADLDAAEVTSWVERRWVCPDLDGSEIVFQEIDVARIRLIHDLRRGMDVPEATLPLVLSLLDQVYALRGALSAIAGVLEDQPQAVRDTVLTALHNRRI